MLLGLAAPTAFAVHNVVHPASGPGTMSGHARGDDFGGPPTGGRPGGPPRAEVDNAALVSLLEVTDNRWAAATVDSMGAGGLQLSSGASVMAIGGFTGSDESPTLAQFQQYVADSDVRYFIADQRGAPPDGPGDGGPPGGPPGRHGGSASEITEWVEQNFTSTDVGGATVYDLQAQ